MTAITTGVLLMRWPLVSAVLMFLASTLNIQFRKSDYAFLAVVCSGLGIAAALWFATGLLGLTMADFAVMWSSFKDVMVEISSHAPPEWPMVMP
ncbi:YjcB family protein [Enterobacteriaceae bacterium H11S18]|uniref:YjcB family protein n=1 Tax=Dryocola clanedunensis TaxID=2925396 RepID=UPI0022F0BB04|nr:YjcB family protein [Dryocola clanedunensis]MCT4709814.1 YjcB family protein [Dryocola clanedunensis]